MTIGGRVTFCPGIRIGARSFVVAGAVLTKDVPADVLAIGAPASFQSLPADLTRGNLPELLLPQTDLFVAHKDEYWREEENGLATPAS